MSDKTLMIGNVLSCIASIISAIYFALNFFKTYSK